LANVVITICVQIKRRYFMAASKECMFLDFIAASKITDIEEKTG
jgi:hypothetical protein